MYGFERHSVIAEKITKSVQRRRHICYMQLDFVVASPDYGWHRP